MRYAREHVDDLRCGLGWEVEFPRDVWELHRLGIEGRKRLKFDGIPQPWLRGLVKRFARWRLSIGRSPIQTYIDVQAVTRLARFLESAPVNVTGLADVDRTTLERYLADLSTDTRAPRSRAATSARWVRSWTRSAGTSGITTCPPVRRSSPTTSPSPTNACRARWPSTSWPRSSAPPTSTGGTTPHDRLLTVILIRCGLRVTDPRRAAFDCVVHDGDGAPYLRYLNHKMKREALVPIDEELERGDHRPAAPRPATDGRHGSPCCSRARGRTPTGATPLTTHTYRGCSCRWLARCDVRDEHGRPVHLTPHQWRHTFGTRLINRDVPQEVVRILLDHDSAAR